MDKLKNELIELGIKLGNIASVKEHDSKKNEGFMQLWKQDVNRNLVEFHCILHQKSVCKNEFEISRKSLEGPL